jgi:hypothetical protein
LEDASVKPPPDLRRVIVALALAGVPRLYAAGCPPAIQAVPAQPAVAVKQQTFAVPQARVAATQLLLVPAYSTAPAPAAPGQPGLPGLPGPQAGEACNDRMRRVEDQLSQLAQQVQQVRQAQQAPAYPQQLPPYSQQQPPPAYQPPPYPQQQQPYQQPPTPTPPGPERLPPPQAPPGYQPPERPSTTVTGSGTPLARLVQDACIRCHNGARTEGGLDLTDLARLSPRARLDCWAQVRTGLMPQGGPRLSPEQQDVFLQFALAR